MNLLLRQPTLFVLLAAACLISLAGCSATPQLAGDEDCIAATDALLTAVSSKRQELLDASAAEIERLRSAGKLPDDAFESLSAVVARARAGEWAESRATLKKFIQGQRPAAKVKA